MRIKIVVIVCNLLFEFYSLSTDKNTQSDSPLVCMTSSPQNEQKKMQERNNARKQPEASAANSPRFNPLKVGDLRKPIAKMNADEFLAVLDQIEKELETKKE
eukprot:m.31983 g.31983  ORF g.31983 m.31983 type:complete len:102 (+) comp31582_c1_seq3:381-686(+)